MSGAKLVAAASLAATALVAAAVSPAGAVARTGVIRGHVGVTASAWTAAGDDVGAGTTVIGDPMATFGGAGTFQGGGSVARPMPCTLVLTGSFTIDMPRPQGGRQILHVQVTIQISSVGMGAPWAGVFEGMGHGSMWRGPIVGASSKTDCHSPELDVVIPHLAQFVI